MYIDNLRLLVIVFVVFVHLAVTYSGFGSWYFKEGRQIGIISSAVFGFFQSFTQAYFMGFLFLIAGYFVPGAYDRKGLAGFVKDRFIRLGLPTLLYMLLINPFILFVQLDLYWIRPKPDFVSFYADYIGKLWFLEGSGPLWFAFALLIFSLLYGIARYFLPKLPDKPDRRVEIGLKEAAGLIVFLAVSTFLVRLVQPIGTSIINMQLCFFPQYIVLFFVGILAYRNNLFARLDYRCGRRWLRYGFILGLVVWSAIMLFGGALNGEFLFNGGYNWQAAAFAFWESFVAVAMVTGLITLFRDKYNYQSRLIKILSDNSFAVYVFHAPIIIAAAQWFHPVNLLPIGKFIILCFVTIPVCFVFTHYIARRIPILRRIL